MLFQVAGAGGHDLYVGPTKVYMYSVNCTKAVWSQLEGG